MSDHGRGELAGNMMCTDWNQPQESVWTNLLTEEQRGKGRKTRKEGRMREALDNMDGCGGVDDVSRHTSSLYLSDDYKEVKDHIMFACLLFHVYML